MKPFLDVPLVLLVMMACSCWSLSAALGAGAIYLGPEWGGAAALRPSQPSCVDIPENLTLCRGIGYTRMRLPNLLDHDSMAEVGQQSSSWVPLFNLKCHPDTQLFLCSLFAPVCLDRPIYPCRSLCEAVRTGCEGRMRAYGFPWPDMVRCDKFPLDNDMCISVMANTNTEPQSCSACNQPDTYENIIDNYCRADFVIKTKIRRLQRGKLSCKRARILKIREGSVSRREVRRPTLRHANLSTCCGELAKHAGKKARLLVMGNREGEGTLTPTFIMEWQDSVAFKGAVRAMKRIDCSNPQIISETVEEGGNADESERRRRSKKRPLSAKKKKKANRHPPSGTLAVVSGGPAPTFRT
ncbi:secreted frizzled-related protein 5-like [Uloborus diversus]|uniref:secreted frizzled-related protein 5-like n=1 Tax=Uloborus diversus TaxID=327109 RepID=UPI0024090031|nr:secreted frizzled-related protein 5-like [Uloborus diversus]